ncbi:MAG: ABC transporter permease subunit [Aestuariivirga sp.]|uniref:ABC transporter permease n=1 Tax=Aestuariivirga sp. TaxID=2650926 RepID=UPI0025BEFB3B|nr:ABC transporter permease subunit [Aestuariivirga sp.]MCA3561605.1 ABC transporter permease subunit [Aestuariivirga sp.]
MSPPELLALIAEFSEKQSPIDFVLILSHWDIFLTGIKNTILLVLFGLVFGAIVALPMAIARWRRIAILSEAIAGFVYVIRGSPMLVQAYILYFGLAQFEAVRESVVWPVLKSPWFCAAIAFAINSAAYQVEIYRGGLNAVPRGEIEAAAAIGMSRTMALRRIILPSALRRCLPMMANESIFLLHGSAIASMLTVIDVLGAARRFNAQYYLAYEGFLAATVIYMVLVFGITRILGFVERKTLKHLALRSATNRIQTQLI